MSYQYQPMHEQSTPRRCSLCPAPASFVRYSMDNKGQNKRPTGIDKSSRTFVCQNHKEV